MLVGVRSRIWYRKLLDKIRPISLGLLIGIGLLEVNDRGSGVRVRGFSIFAFEGLAVALPWPF